MMLPPRPFTKKIFQRLRNPFLAAFIVFAVLSFGLMKSETGQCWAQTMGSFSGGPNVSVPGGSCPCCSKPPCPVDCEPSGTASTTAQTVYSTFNTSLSNLAITTERAMRQIIDEMMATLLRRIHTMELNLIAWWQTMWFYNLLPAMQAMTDQINVQSVEQSKNIQAALDADLGNTVARQQAFNESESFKEVAGENGCPTATLAGGLSRSTEIGRGMRSAWQFESQSMGSNRLPENPGGDNSDARGEAAVNFRENKVFENYFCDPNDNGGDNKCDAGVSPEFYNADTRITDIMYSKKTIPVGNTGDGEKYKVTVEKQIENLMGSTKIDPVPEYALGTPQGQENWLDRRSYLARHAAAATVPQYIAAQRMPGSRMGPWVKEVRKAAGLQDLDISDNPSYREVMSAMASDRFGSGSYATTQITSPEEVEREKLALSTLHLMRLRDYHDLLERMALNLSLQVAMLSDDIPLPSVQPRPR